MERLQKVIAQSGVASRRKSEELIKTSRVKVNGKIVTEMGYKVDRNDIILVDNKRVDREVKEYYILNKPRGVISSSSDDKNRKTVVELIDTKSRIYPVGRLDYDTTGLLILTNDGEFANFMMHPKNNIEKVYVAKIKGILSVEDIKKLENGVMIDGRKTSRCRVKIKKKNIDTNTSIVQLTIHEGRNHQVKKMFISLGYDVVKLKRERVGNLVLGNLKSGEYKRLDDSEIKQVYDFIKFKK